MKKSLTKKFINSEKKFNCIAIYINQFSPSQGLISKEFLYCTIEAGSLNKMEILSSNSANYVTGLGMPDFKEIDYNGAWQELYLPTYQFLIDLLKTIPFDFNNAEDESYFYNILTYCDQRNRQFLFEVFAKLENEGFFKNLPIESNLKIDFGMCNNYMYTVYFLSKAL